MESTMEALSCIAREKLSSSYNSPVSLIFYLLLSFELGSRLKVVCLMYYKEVGTIKCSCVGLLSKYILKEISSF
ncbi:unnamed protein product, partial [Sphenostylis stenocarpa]